MCVCIYICIYNHQVNFTFYMHGGCTFDRFMKRGGFELEYHVLLFTSFAFQEKRKHKTHAHTHTHTQLTYNTHTRQTSHVHEAYDTLE